MRILLIFHYSAMNGGANFSGLNMLRGLVALGHDVTALVPTDGELCALLDEGGFKYKKIFFRQAWPYTIGTPASIVRFAPKALQEWFINRKAVAEIEKWAREEVHPDVVHSNSSVMSVGYKVAKRLGVPHITHFREYGYKDTGFVSWHVRKMLSYPRQYNIAISEAIARYHSLPAGTSAVIYNGIYSSDDYPENSTGIPAREDYLLYVGGLYDSKGIEDILEAYAGLPAELRKRHKLRLAGSPNSPGYDRMLKDKTAALDIDHDVEWLGHRTDVASLMRKARGLVIASHNEAFGRIMAEAAFNRCPVIARDSCGLHEQFEQGKRLTGREIGLRFNTSGQLRDRILTLLGSCHEELSEMVDAGYRAARLLYTNEANAGKISDFYKTKLHETI